MKKLGKNLAQLMKQKGKIGEKTVLMLGVRMVRELVGEGCMVSE